MARVELNNVIEGVLGPLPFAGEPVDGTSGTFKGKAAKGCLLIDITNANLYINTNTQASPTWVLVGPPA